jgi:hypothetical protein
MLFRALGFTGLHFTSYVVKIKIKKKSPMGIMEGCPGYWERDSSSHGYCSPATCKGSEPGHIRKTKRNQ